MSENARPYCPECEPTAEDQAGFDRRQFLRTAGVAALAAAGAAGLPRLAAAADGKAETKKPARPAEEMVRELFASLKDDQKKAVVLPYDHGPKGDDFPTRKRMYNGPIGGKGISDVYTEPQQELIQKILQAISSGEEGYRLFTRNGTFDGSKSLQGCGATPFVFAGGSAAAWCATADDWSAPKGRDTAARGDCFAGFRFLACTQLHLPMSLRILAKSHNRVVPSEPSVTSHWPSGDRADRIPPCFHDWNRCTRLPVATSQM